MSAIKISRLGSNAGGVGGLVHDKRALPVLRLKDVKKKKIAHTSLTPTI